MSERVTNESRSFHGSNVYLTSVEKDSLIRAIDQYFQSVSGSEIDGKFRKFFEKYDEANLHNIQLKLIGKSRK